MQETIKFELSSRMAIIRKPESNEIYFTYTFPHKIMLLGILGAIIGLNGYNYYCLRKYLKKKVDDLPEFYTKLKNLKIAVVPNIHKTNFNKKIQTFNNSVGYASEEQGNNLIVKEQWIENPTWDIYILSDESDEYKQIKDYLLNSKCEYIPYIGKNDHFANIDNVEILQTELIKSEKVNSLFFKKDLLETVDDFASILAFDEIENIEKEYEFTEKLPTCLDAQIGYTNFENFMFTNNHVNINSDVKLYKAENKVLFYF